MMTSDFELMDTGRPQILRVPSSSSSNSATDSDAEEAIKLIQTDSNMEDLRALLIRKCSLVEDAKDWVSETHEFVI